MPGDFDWGEKDIELKTSGTEMIVLLRSCRAAGGASEPKVTRS